VAGRPQSIEEVRWCSGQVGLLCGRGHIRLPRFTTTDAALSQTDLDDAVRREIGLVLR